MKNVMVDLETLGTIPGCAILSIGAVLFDKTGVSPVEFYQEIRTTTCTDVFLTVDAKTKKWWSEQNEKARALLDRCVEGGEDLTTALDSFGTFIRREAGYDALVWGNGADFDNAILAVAYDITGRKLPWRFTNNRCYRTLKNLHRDIALHRTGTYHNALDDARCQAEHAVRLLQRQDDCSNLWGEYLDDSVREGARTAVQQESAGRTEGGEHQDHTAGERVARSPVPTGIRV
jgi:DNA polymerase III epsilon subunit-like protein